MSVFIRIWNFIRNPTGYVGKDFHGNYFYEFASKTGGKSRRVMKYQGQTDILALAERSRQLPVQWKAWLTHTREHPPTLEELRTDMLRQERLRQNVALIEARERLGEERLKLATGPQHGQENGQAALSAPQRGLPARNDRSDRLEDTRTVRVESLPVVQKRDSRRAEKKFEQDPWVALPASDELQSWTPRVVQRGG